MGFSWPLEGTGGRDRALHYRATIGAVSEPSTPGRCLLPVDPLRWVQLNEHTHLAMHPSRTHRWWQTGFVKDDVIALNVRERIHILEGLLDALSRFDEVNDAVRRSLDRAVASRVLQSPPFGYTELVADHVLDLHVARQTVAGMEQLRQERLRAIETLERLGPT